MRHSRAERGAERDEAGGVAVLYMNLDDFKRSNDSLGHQAGDSAEGEDASDDPLGWYQARFGNTPDYAEVIDGLAKSQAERGNLLKGYFEPTEAEREEGKKVPTSAHEAVARLAAGGYVNVILTTNFDRLM